MQLTGFDWRIAFVTGSAGGIGQALVRQLLQAGSTVVATDVSAPTQAAADGAGGHLLPHALDVSDGDAVTRLVQQIEAQVGPIALGVNVAVWVMTH